MSDHQHAWPGSQPLDCTDIGGGACLTPQGRHGEPDDVIGGYLFGHDLPDGAPRCVGGVHVMPLDGGAVWQQTGTLAGGDLTLTPSVLCTPHGFHGFVTNGKWVPA